MIDPFFLQMVGVLVEDLLEELMEFLFEESSVEEILMK